MKSPSSEPRLSSLRARVTTQAINVTAIAAPLVSLLIIISLSRRGELETRTLFLCAFTLTFGVLRAALPYLRYPIAGSIYLLLMLIMAFAIQLRGGVATAASALLLLIVLLSGLLFGARGVVIGLGANLACFGLAGYAVVHGLTPPVKISMWDPNLPQVWLRGGVVLTLFGGAAAFAVVDMIARLRAETRLLRRALDREEREKAARLAAEVEREHARTALAESQRLESVGRIASGVAHDFNNILTVITGASEMASLETDLPRSVERCLSDIRQAASKGADLTRNLLLMGRKENGRLQAIEISEFLEATVEAMRRVLPSDIELEISSRAPAVVNIDPTQLERVLFNLLINARDAIDKEGRIEIGCQIVETSADPVKSDEDECARHVAIWIRDDGCGMDTELQKRVFEPYFTTKAVGKGTGIGMALVQSLVAEAKGSISLESEPGAGTVVTLRLPVSNATQVSRTPNERPRSLPKATGRSTVLIVEDDPAVLTTMSRILAAAGFATVHCSDGDAASDIITTQPESFDLLCIDGVIPGTPSAEVIETLRDLSPTTPIVVCSGYVDEELLRRGIRTGELASVSKPFTPEELVESISVELDRARSKQ